MALRTPISDDSAFTAAVAKERSWRGVARALGMNATSAGTIRALKRRAKLLGVDSSHFTRQRTWSDRALIVAVAQASSWAEVLEFLGLSGGDARVRLKGHSVRLGLDIDHLEAAARSAPVLDVLSNEPRREFLRDAAEAFANAWFTIRGLPVAVPSRPASYDLLVTFPDGVRRIQVKTTTFRGRHGTWTVNVGRRPYELDGTASRTAYDPHAIDYFFVIDGDWSVFLIPSSVVGGRLAINVGAYSDYRIGDASSLFS